MYYTVSFQSQNYLFTIWRIQITYIVHQVFVFIGMACQLSIKEPASSHAENVIATHTKYIGAIKLALSIIYAVCIFTKFMEFMVNSFVFCISFNQKFQDTALFIGIDFFLVPIVIQMTEIKNTNPNVITTVPISLPVVDVQKIEISLS